MVYKHYTLIRIEKLHTSNFFSFILRLYNKYWGKENILGLSNLIIKDISIIPDFTCFEIEISPKLHKCPCCSTITNQIYSYRLQIAKVPS